MTANFPGWGDRCRKRAILGPTNINLCNLRSAMIRTYVATRHRNRRHNRNAWMASNGISGLQNKFPVPAAGSLVPPAIVGLQSYCHNPGIRIATCPSR